ncbi:DoxX family membrane protein [Streptomyces sp. ASQP_92]|uniref:DoxX family membrane protein n=1 Tax=Streptomyces sp. ASQP_92 TaxID=2979116 RepID=UPI0021C0080F|nr:DoxX family membrane protein [Streptomyces sp. ASQP_92]MCT9091197.1 DoxX family membrane protein [Streptomyces sp. ASQP_92]
MSVDTRTPRPGFDDQPALSMAKVDCDPAQVIVNHASFRVQLAPKSLPKPVISGTSVRRRAPVVWSGKSAPGASGLLQAVRATSVAGAGDGYETGATQTIPRVAVDDTRPTPLIPGAGSGPETALLPQMRTPYGEQAYAQGEFEDFDGLDGDPDDGSPAKRRGADPVRHAYYPGRRMNLGVVLLPLRVFLGFISVYAGLGKLCDPVYFDGGERGSMVKWLHSLHPWALAEPLRDFALQHPVGAGLTVAFLQVVVGVLTMLGLWQRVAAVFGALLSGALLVTVSWQTVRAYDAPDIIYLAAWSPLIIAGAPVYSLDARLAGEAWRKLGPRSELWELRRRVLRRGLVMTTVVVGLTLTTGALLGGAVRSTTVVTVPGPDDDPTNYLPGTPLPSETGPALAPRTTPTAVKPSAKPKSSVSPSAKASKKPKAHQSATAGTTGRPSHSAGTGGQPPTRHHTAPQAPPSTSAGPTSSGGTGSGGSGGGGGGGGGNRNPIGGLLG